MKMSNEKFRVILVPIVAIIVILAIVLSMAASTYSATLDMVFGRGKRHVVNVDDINEESTRYYDVMFPNPDAGTLENTDPPTEIEEQSRNEAAKTALKVAEEGITLLKNDGILPLAKNSEVTPFGYRYVEPIWGGSGSAATNMDYDYVVTAEEALAMNYDVNETVVNKMKAATPLALSGDVANAPSNATWSKGIPINTAKEETAMNEFFAKRGIGYILNAIACVLGIVCLVCYLVSAEDKSKMTETFVSALVYVPLIFAIAVNAVGLFYSHSMIKVAAFALYFFAFATWILSKKCNVQSNYDI